VTSEAGTGNAGYFSEDEVRALALGSVGTRVRISRLALLLAPQRIAIADDAIIEPFVVLSPSAAGLRIGRGVRIGAYVSILGQREVDIGDGVEIGMRCSIFTSNDDYSGATLLTPTVADRYRGGLNAAVRIDEGARLGEDSVVLPGIRIGRGAVVEPFSLVAQDVPAGATVAGRPARLLAPPVGIVGVEPPPGRP
jgi:dTDP-4-amino-4,6-dideoxy-D-glucose acyltransferase